MAAFRGGMRFIDRINGIVVHSLRLEGVVGAIVGVECVFLGMTL